ncbi:MAG TPA: S1 RNA-binding domain-containing protein, partial [Arthrobacter sp.]|nr:S1 RNA-binding domain-containing protein [Arthrobacter sp.]
HQDGLVHISAMSNKFISDPHEVVKSGQVVKVKVLEADPDRKRISLTLRLDDEAGARPGGRASAGRDGTADRSSGNGGPAKGSSGNGGPAKGSRPGPARDRGDSRGNSRSGGRPNPPRGRDNRNDQPPGNTAMAEALRRAGLGK